MNIQGVCGEVRREDLGIVAPHEHVLLDLTAFYQELPVPGIEDPATQKVEMWNLGILSRDCYALKDNLRLTGEEVAVKELTFFKNAGGQTVVDASLPGIGRDPLGLARISEKPVLILLWELDSMLEKPTPKSLTV